MKRRTGSWVLLATMVFLAAFRPAAAAESGFYVGVSVTRAKQDLGQSPGTVIAIDSPFSGGLRQVYPDAVDADDASTGWNALLGYRINRHIAAELAYADFGTTDVSEHYSFDLPGSFPPLPIELTNDYSSSIAGPMVSLLGSLPLGKRFNVFARGGVLFADQEIRLHFGQGSQSMTFGSRVWIWGAGIDGAVTDRWTIRAEYTGTGTLDATLTSAETEIGQTSLSVLFRL
ncbi:MAG TPA: outer membrane beta-barrel protein [Povalibacter sp.]|nr:outer membrane beta-barrel protein [Povalibacter sp.]